MADDLTERVARSLAREASYIWEDASTPAQIWYRETARAALAVVAGDVDGIAGVLRDHFVLTTSLAWYCNDNDCEWVVDFGSDEGDEPDPVASFARHQAAMVAAHIRGGA